MPTFIYKPNDPDSNENGIVEKGFYESIDAPNVISDEMGALVNHADGKMYTSKRRFRQATRDANCVEIGNESLVTKHTPVQLDRRQRREDIRKAIHDIRDGRAPSIRQIIEMNGKE